MYEELVKQLRDKAGGFEYDGWVDTAILLSQAADAIEELLRAASAMHTWIFLNTADEQAAYDECGLRPEMNAALGSMGGFEMEVDDD